ncbi:hypothetical protein F0U60_51525 [Archangium minus]|uniref:Uncharacterized protein n=1 Tax=Archangium minus TaxID=83450 RepID=A0ABY9X8B1_9BACT|nr:hypothetical protein F0U60_51525 [Archangium minus]
MQVTPHFLSLVPDGVFVPREGGVRFEPLPPPTQGEVERLLKVVRHRVLRLLEKRGALPAQGPEDALQAYQAHSLQRRLRWTEVDVRPPPRKQPRCAFMEGFSLHANTHLHANDRQGLGALCIMPLFSETGFGMAAPFSFIAFLRACGRGVKHLVQEGCPRSEKSLSDCRGPCRPR